MVNALVHNQCLSHPERRCCDLRSLLGVQVIGLVSLLNLPPNPLQSVVQKHRQREFPSFECCNRFISGGTVGVLGAKRQNFNREAYAGARCRHFSGGQVDINRASGGVGVSDRVDLDVLEPAKKVERWSCCGKGPCSLPTPANAALHLPPSTNTTNASPVLPRRSASASLQRCGHARLATVT